MYHPCACLVNRYSLSFPITKCVQPNRRTDGSVVAGGDETHRLTNTWWGRNMVCLSADQFAENLLENNGADVKRSKLEGRSGILTWKWILEYPDQLWNHVETRECRQQWPRRKFPQYLHLHLRPKNTYPRCEFTATAEEAKWRPKTEMMICDPSYWDPAKTKVIGKVVRYTNILEEPIPKLLNEDDKLIDTGQIIITQVCKDDINATMVSWGQRVTSEDRYVTMVSTVLVTAVTYLGFEYRSVHDGDRRGFTVKLATKYVDECLGIVQLQYAKAVMTPLNLHDQTTACDQVQHALFRAVVGKLQYITGVRPDLIFATKCLSYKLASPTLADLTCAKKEWKYLKRTRELNLYLTIPALKPNDLNKTLKHITGYSGADWADDPVTRKSTSCTLCYVGQFLLTSECRGQGTVALSSGESERYAPGALSAELIFAQTFLKEIGLSFLIHARADSSTARALATKQGASRKMKHIHTRFLFIQDLVLRKLLTMSSVKTDVNPSDIGTKALGRERFLAWVLS